MELTPSQDQVAADTHRFRVLCCGRRFGKTTLAVEEIKGFALYKGGSNITYIATTYQQARDIAWSTLVKELSPIILDKNEARLELTVRSLSGEPSKISLRGWESIDTLRGQKFDFIVLDEVASMRNFFLHWQEVVRPTLTDTKGKAMFLSTPKGFNHFYDLYNFEYGIGDRAPDPDFKSFRFTSYDNPFLDPEELTKARNEVGETRFSQEYLASFTKTEGLVYKEFSRETHLFSGDPKGQIVEKIVGIDFGFTNPACVLEIFRDSSDTYWLTSEWYQTHKTDAEVAEYAASLNANRYYPDPAAAGGVEELKRKRVRVMTVVKGKDSIKSGITRVAELLRANKLKVHISCKNTIQEFETYSYPEKDDDRNNREVPEDANNHAMDALRYPIMMLAVAPSSGARQFYPTRLPSPTASKSTAVRYPQAIKPVSKRQRWAT